jgi:hypothetical protein
MQSGIGGWYIMPANVGSININPATEWLRLSERYRQMSDDELLALARQGAELTDAAKQALEGEISRRGLKVPREEPPVPQEPGPPPDSLYAEDRELVEVCTVWSLPDALQLQTLLDRAGIPVFIGPEKATGVEAVTSNFASGVSVRVMRVGLPWARHAMLNYTPANEPPQQQAPEWRELPIRCPKCQSTEVVFEGLLPTATDDSTFKYEWTCGSCGHHWEDEGVVGET